MLFGGCQDPEPLPVWITAFELNGLLNSPVGVCAAMAACFLAAIGRWVTECLAFGGFRSFW